MDLREQYIKEKGYSNFNNTVLNEYTLWLEKKITDNAQALQLQQTGVIKSVCIHCNEPKEVKRIDGSYWCKACRKGW